MLTVRCEEFMSFRLVYDLLLLRFVLGASFISPMFENMIMSLKLFSVWVSFSFSFFSEM